MKFLVNGADAEAAYAGFLEFKVVVKKNQGTSTDVELWHFKVESGQGALASDRDHNGGSR